ncbi:MAG: metalloregulator ArsR/SmtB family transcription factor [Treponemataceae bacterium]|uniref:ArsR/SmtB family transcription factor n=1 Tax=Treponema sp. J25 TaxID=2094121 RepID=UPI001042BC3F|nr:metalloregulator ArsR/SmtB family transcription factor [Treponema sp. J25]MCX7950103.1 metalloregulator ArsR/SmtB family transcription factor [Treponemataceae bacterium]TCW60885.1 transcriptional regulator [Treponema sp. J25]
MNPEQVCPEKLIQELSRKLKVCGHPVRLKLLCLIYHQGEPCVTNLWTCLGESQPVISQHLAVLKEQGIVDSTVQGNKRIYTIKDDFIRAIVERIVEVREEKSVEASV